MRVCQFLSELLHLRGIPFLYHSVHIEEWEGANIYDFNIQVWIANKQTGSNQARVRSVSLQGARNGNNLKAHIFIQLILVCNSIYYLAIYQQVQSEVKMTHRLSISSNNFNKTKKATSYRVILKSRSGDHRQHKQSSRLNNNKMSATETSFDTKSIKDYVKNMKNKTQQHNTSTINTSQKVHNNKIIQNEPQANQVTHVKLQNLTLRQLQQKVDQLIQAKLNQTKDRVLRQTNTQQINKQMNNIIQFLHNPNFECARINQDEDIDISKRKIDIIEKIMAESTIESQAVKKYFHGKKINRKPKNPWHYQYKYDMKSLKQKTIDVMNNTLATVNLETTNRNSFKAPDKKYYPSRPNKVVYEFKNQPLPRSSYSRDYLTYGSLPRFNYKESSSNLMPFSTSKSQCSSYRSEFTNKKIQRLDFKELDCYKDKFTNIKISFINQAKSNTMSSGKIIQKQKLQQKANEPQQKHIRHKTQQCHYTNSMNSQFQKNFKGQNSRIKSQIKHKHLNDLKYAYKAYAHA